MEFKEINLNQIILSEQNTRKDLTAGTEDADLDDLAESIKQKGLINPITVKMNSEGNYELIAGQRRFLACNKLGWSKIPAMIREIDDDTDATIISLIENVHRAEMNPIDKARAYQKIYEKHNTYTKVAKETGVTSDTVSKYMKLLDLAPSIQERVSTSEGSASIGTLSKLAKTFKKEEQEKVLKEIGGFKQPIQYEILKKSEGDFSKIRALKEKALDGAFDVVTCSKIENCIHIPKKLIPIILDAISDYEETENLEDFEETIINLRNKL